MNASKKKTSFCLSKKAFFSEIVFQDQPATLGEPYVYTVEEGPFGKFRLSQLRGFGTLPSYHLTHIPSSAQKISVLSTTVAIKTKRRGLIIF
jgi:hypothetical protein